MACISRPGYFTFSKITYVSRADELPIRIVQWTLGSNLEPVSVADVNTGE